MAAFEANACSPLPRPDATFSQPYMDVGSSPATCTTSTGLSSSLTRRRASNRNASSISGSRIEPSEKFAITAYLTKPKAADIKRVGPGSKVDFISLGDINSGSSPAVRGSLMVMFWRLFIHQCTP
ncbi:MAG: hypothetical protein ABJB17_05890 [Burkholderiales bacterium]